MILCNVEFGSWQLFLTLFLYHFLNNLFKLFAVVLVDEALDFFSYLCITHQRTVFVWAQMLDVVWIHHELGNELRRSEIAEVNFACFGVDLDVGFVVEVFDATMRLVRSRLPRECKTIVDWVFLRSYLLNLLKYCLPSPGRMLCILNTWTILPFLGTLFTTLIILRFSVLLFFLTCFIIIIILSRKLDLITFTLWLHQCQYLLYRLVSKCLPELVEWFAARLVCWFEVARAVEV